MRVLDRFPFLAPFLARARERASYRSVLRFGERLLAAHAPNAFFLNLLLLSEGAAVERHVDATLRKPSGDAEAVPRVVSVLYLQVPPASGGELVLHQGGREVGRVRPSEGTLLHFSGNLAHEVLPFSGAPDSRRASLVLEQYYLAPEFLAALPEFHLQSRAGFSAYLADHSRRPMAGASFELDG